MVAPIRQRVATPTTRPIQNVPSAVLVSRSPRDWDAEDTAVEAPAAAARKRTRIAVIRDEARDERKMATITYACDRCDDEAPSPRSICRHCEGTLTAVARVDAFSVEVAGDLFCRGAETDERIAEACALVDSHCREDVEWLLRNGPAEDSDTIIAEVTAPVRVAAIDRNSDVAPMSLIDCLRESLRVAAQESRADFKTKTMAMAQLGPGGSK